MDAVLDRNYINMIGERCILKRLYKCICLTDNFMLLNLLEVTYQKANAIFKLKQTLMAYNHHNNFSKMLTNFSICL